MRRWLCAIGILLAAACSARASIIYLPVVYEYGSSPRFYYGGNDPAIIAQAERAAATANVTNRTDVPQPIRVYCDALPYVPDASIFGYTASDARNQAYASMPRYFRMADLLSNSRVERDGTIVVAPTMPGTIDIKPFVRHHARATTQPAPTTRPVVMETRSVVTAR